MAKVPVEEVHRPETKKAPPAHVDVAARMADPLPGIELSDMPLARAVDLLAAASTLPVTLDADAMRQLGVSPRDPISLRLDSTTVGQACKPWRPSAGWPRRSTAAR